MLLHCMLHFMMCTLYIIYNFVSQSVTRRTTLTLFELLCFLYVCNQMVGCRSLFRCALALKNMFGYRSLSRCGRALKRCIYTLQSTMFVAEIHLILVSMSSPPKHVKRVLRVAHRSVHMRFFAAVWCLLLTPIPLHTAWEYIMPLLVLYSTHAVAVGMLYAVLYRGTTVKHVCTCLVTSLSNR